jgi:hypothetical protein
VQRRGAQRRGGAARAAGVPTALAPTAAAVTPGQRTGPVRPTGPATRTATAPVEDASVLGPNGWAGLVIGASADVAAASGIFADTPSAATGCHTWPGLGVSAIEGAVISPRQGVVAILSAPDKVLSTPEGLQIGWAAAQVGGAYPDFAAGRVADVPEFALVSRAADCPVRPIPV